MVRDHMDGSPDQPHRPDQITSTRAACAFFLCVMLAYAAIILSAKNPPPFVDLPDWVYQGVLFQHVLASHPVAGYTLKHYPVPNSATSVGIGLLNLFLPWQWAGKLWIVFYLALASFTTWSVLKALVPNQWQPILAIPGIVFLNLNFWYGHINFEIGLCLTLLLLAMLVRRAPAPHIALLLVFIFFAHMEACACALLLLLLWSITTHRPRLLLASAPTLALTLWYAAARLSHGNADGRGLPGQVYPYLSRPFLLYKLNTFLKPFAYVNARLASGPSQSETIFGRPLFVLFLLVSIALAVLCLSKILRVCTNPAAPSQTTLRRLVPALLVTSAVLPQAWLGVSDPGSRLILLAAAAGLLLIDWRTRAGLAIATLSALLCVANLWQFARIEHNPQLAAHAPDLPAALLLYGHVEPATRLQYYDHLDRGQMDEPIFPTALFVQSRPTQQEPAP